jgi:hypothetical protein
MRLTQSPARCHVRCHFEGGFGVILRRGRISDVELYTTIVAGETREWPGVSVVTPAGFARPWTLPIAGELRTA